MRLIRSLVLAFSYYSAIPAPPVRFEEHDGDYLFCFFPLVGLLIGAAEYLWMFLAEMKMFNPFLTGAAAVAIPVLITGGIHLDGFLDTSDALASWKTKEERLAILHDTHTGAFAVIFCALYLMLACGTAVEAVSQVPAAGCMIFCIGRMFSALLVVFEKPAGESGMLYYCTKTAAARAVALSSVIYLAITGALSLYLNALMLWLVLLAAGAVFFILYRLFIRRVFGGVTGDLAGCFLTVCELVLGLTAVFFF